MAGSYSISDADLKNKKLFVFFLFMLFVLPWPHGGELLWEFYPFSLAVFAICAIKLCQTSFPNLQKNAFRQFIPLKAPVVLLSFWLSYTLFQLIPLPPEFLSMISPHRALLCDSLTSNQIGCDNWQPITISISNTASELIKYTTYLSVFILTFIFINTKQRLLLTANVLFFSSVLMALYSLLNHFTNGAVNLVDSIPPWTVTWDKATHGTFSYQNHYASFLTITIPIGFGLIYANLKNNAGEVAHSLASKLMEIMFSINGLYLLSMATMLLALIKTSSRGGTSIFFIGILLTFLLVLLCNQNYSFKQKVQRLSAFFIGLLLLVVLTISAGMADSLFERLDKQGYTPNGRDLMHLTSAQIITDYPMVGSGAGTYPVLQHVYKTPKLGHSEMSKRAHNDYLELFGNQGLIGFGLLVSAIFLLMSILFRSVIRRKSDLFGMQVACFCSTLTVLLHSLVDFNFQLPVIATYFFIVLAIGLICNSFIKHNQQNNTLRAE